MSNRDLTNWSFPIVGDSPSQAYARDLCVEHYNERSLADTGLVITTTPPNIVTPLGNPWENHMRN